MRWSLGCWLLTGLYMFILGFVGAYSTRKIVICSVEVGVDYCRVVTSPPEGDARYCFYPVCLSVCVSVCPANILVFYFSATRRDIDLKFIPDTYSIV